MTLTSLLIAILILCLVIYLVGLLPIHPRGQTLIYVVVVVVFILWLVNGQNLLS